VEEATGVADVAIENSPGTGVNHDDGRLRTIGVVIQGVVNRTGIEVHV